jgi:cell division inhibitor SulA
MPKFVIERDLPGASSWTDAEVRAISQQSNKILRELGPQIQWIQSFVTDNKLYCVYLAPDEDTIREHARRAGFPANRISAVRQLLDPTSAE